jgi:hypothetical protein
MTRDEFIADLKKRALELARAGDLQHAVAMMTIEVNRRADSHVHHAVHLAGTLRAMNEDRQGVIDWIEGFA